MRTTIIILVTALLSLSGCASAGSSGGSGGGRDLLTSEDLREAEVGTQDLETVIQRLRPRWLRARSTDMMGQAYEVVVYMDGSRLGGPELLRTISVTDVDEVRYLSGPDATTRYGTGHAGGVIQITSRR